MKAMVDSQTLMMMTTLDFQERMAKAMLDAMALTDNNPKVLPTDLGVMVFGINLAAMKVKCLCVRFQQGKCTYQTDHRTKNKPGMFLKHICDSCDVLKKAEDSSHGPGRCPHKSQFFQ